MLWKTLIAWLMRRAAGLRHPYLFAVAAALFLIDLAVPDVIPLVDELLLGLIALALANWRRRDGSRETTAASVKRRE